MKNKKLKLLFLIIFIITLGILGFNTKSKANSISKISMDIYVDQNGDAEVTEVWKCSASQGTEVYHPYYNLGNSKISNLTVSEGTNQYTTLSSWNTSGTLSSKAYKCGIHNISNGVELCWGISSYGSHTYTVKYNISKFVSELNDSQMIYWTLIPYDFSNSIGDVQIKIYTDSYIQDTIDVWGYGNYGGLAYVSNGAIYMSSDGRLDSNEYMTILVKFPTGTFRTTNELSGDFDHYYKMAEEGAEKYKDNSVIFAAIITFFIFAVNFIIIVLAITKSGDYSNKDFKISSDDRIALNKASHYRDIPCNGDILKSYYIAFQYGILKKKTDILGAIILSWVRDGIVTLDKKEIGLLKKREDTVVIFDKEKREKITNSKIQEVFDMMYQASGDGILEKKEFEKWCSGKYTRILNWFDNLLKEEKRSLISSGELTTTTKKSFLGNKSIYEPTVELKEYAIQINGLKKYLLDYTLIKERGAIEVALFEDYMIYAQMLGIAKKVAKEFKDLYPELIEQSNFSSYDDILFIHYCSTSGISHANSARAAAQSYSSGGGGFSSGGGGGGSFGGGGGRRRFPLKFNL